MQWIRKTPVKHALVSFREIESLHLLPQAMARLLDPTGRLFGERVISQQDSTSRKTKDLDVVLGAESAVLIIDDTEAVSWAAFVLIVDYATAAHKEVGLCIVDVQRQDGFRWSPTAKPCCASREMKLVQCVRNVAHRQLNDPSRCDLSIVY
jgi:hypothetical protein